ncbi:MAG: ABC-type transport auxiliary lipoprotein family protein [Methylocystis sp.]|uniref:ABC-type transport auxiliary lipoprotein family protein n=1 Tax=Methylocystis sp. TaxID=1911079 RepID=UPI003DA55FFD
MARTMQGARRAGTLFGATLGVALAASAAGCAPPMRQTFDLSAAAGAPPGAERAGPALVVREPTAAPPTSSPRVVVRGADGGVFILPGSEWSAPLPRLLRERMVEALQRAGVGAAAYGLAGVALATDIRRFEIDVARNVAVVELSARLVDANTGAARAAQSFVAETPAPEHTGAPAVMALTEAAGEALAHMARWARGKV